MSPKVKNYMGLKKTKILYLITQSCLGGAQKYVFDLATNLDKEKYEVAVAAGGDGELFRQLELAGVKIFKLRWLRRQICSVRDTLAYFEIKRLLKAWQPAVLHLNSSKAAILGSLAGRRLPIKVIYTVHGAVFEASFSWLARRFFLWLEKWTAKYKDKIICVSEHDRQIWLKYNVAPPEKLVTIHNGIDWEIDFLVKDEARQKLLEKNLPKARLSPESAESVTAWRVKFTLQQTQGIKFPRDDYQIIGTIAYFYPEKNLTTFIEAASLILNNPKLADKKILFVIIGSGPLEKSLKLQVSRYKLQNHVLFLGAIHQAHRYLKAFDVFVLPSIKEGLPYTILEAMAAGIPLVTSDVGGIPEMVQDNISGFLIKPRDAEALAEKILQILENPALSQRFSKNSLEKIKEFSLEKMIEQTCRHY